MTDICIPRAAFAAEKQKWYIFYELMIDNEYPPLHQIIFPLKNTFTIHFSDPGKNEEKNFWMSPSIALALFLIVL